MPVGGSEAGDNIAFTSSYGQGKEAVSTNLEKKNPPKQNRLPFFTVRMVHACVGYPERW